MISESLRKGRNNEVRLLTKLKRELVDVADQGGELVDRTPVAEDAEKAAA